MWMNLRLEKLPLNSLFYQFRGRFGGANSGRYVTIIRLWRQQRDFSGHTIDLSLAPAFLTCLHCRHRFANAAPSACPSRMSPAYNSETPIT